MMQDFLRSDLVKITIPVNKVGYPLFHAGGWFIADIADQIINVCVGGWHIARLHRKQIFLGLFPDSLLNNFYEPRELHRVVAANVVNAIRGLAGAWVRRCATPVAVRLSDLIESTDNTFHNIVDISEVPFVVAMIEHINWFTSQNLLGKDKQGHIWSAPRAVDGKES